MRNRIWRLSAAVLALAVATGALIVGRQTDSSGSPSVIDPNVDAPSGAPISSVATSGDSVPPDMVALPGGAFTMGFESGHHDEVHLHEVVVRSFALDREEVTNAEFAAFVEATGHVTQAENDGYCWSYLEGESDFRAIPGTDWRHPQGPDSSLEGRLDHPVVCVSWFDAQAYAEWAGRRLPTEAEWEYASRANGRGHLRADAGATDEVDEQETQVAGNVWQGTWPERNELEDGYFYTAPVGSFPANEAGVHDMLGNVWEWAADWYAPDFYESSPQRNPKGPPSGEHRVARGGSWFCSPNYCAAYSTHYRGGSPPDHAFNNVGFRCARDVELSSEGKESSS